MVALHLDNTATKASFFHFRLVCCILNLANKHGITLIPTYMPTHLDVEASYLSWGWLVLERNLLLHMAQAALQLCGQMEVDLLGSPCTN